MSGTPSKQNPQKQSKRDNLKEQIQNLKDEAFKKKLIDSGIPEVPLARAFYFRNKMIREKKNVDKRYLVVADLTRHTEQDRLWLIDLQDGKIESYKTAHGSAKGSNAWSCGHVFGNRQSSGASPGGNFVFDCAYDGSAMKVQNRPRRSAYLIGMDKANENSISRQVIFHEGYSLSGALYTTKNAGGRSYGCLTITPESYTDFIGKVSSSTICKDAPAPGKPRGGTPLYVYPEKDDFAQGEPIYWDSACLAEIKAKNKTPTYIE